MLEPETRRQLRFEVLRTALDIATPAELLQRVELLLPGNYSPIRDGGSTRAPPPSGTALSDFQYAGEQKDAETGLLNLRARYYDPTLGRFLSRDALSGRAGFPQSFNRYAYALNNPLRFLDPSGYEAGDCTGSNDSECSQYFDEWDDYHGDGDADGDGDVDDWDQDGIREDWEREDDERRSEGAEPRDRPEQLRWFMGDNASSGFVFGDMLLGFGGAAGSVGLGSTPTGPLKCSTLRERPGTRTP